MSIPDFHYPAVASNFTNKWWILVAIGTGTFMSALDISIINTVLPLINSSFHSTVNAVEWIALVYLLLVSGLLPSFGRLGDLKGHRSVYILGFALFVLGSLLCALSGSVLQLIGARVIQAIGAAFLSSNSPAILIKNFPSSQRGQALGLQATMTYLVLTVGPSLGGWLAGVFGWRAVFLINLPIGILAFILCWIILPKDKPTTTQPSFDVKGGALFLSGLVLLLLAFNQGSNWGWVSIPVLSIIVLASVILFLFVKVERAIVHPMLNLDLIKNRTISSSITAAVINYICVYSSLFLMPFYLLDGRFFTPSQTGLILSSQPLVMALAAPISGTVSDRLGTKNLTILGMAIITFGLAGLAWLNPTTQISRIILSLAVFGLGIGIFITPNSSALLGSAPSNQSGIVSGLLATARNVGMALGVGISGAVFTTILNKNSLFPQSSVFIAVKYGFLTVTLISLLGVLVTSIPVEK